MGFLDNFFSGKQEKISTLSPEQQRLQATLGNRLTALTQQGPNYYQGQLSSPISQGELDALARFNALNRQSQDQLGNLINFNEEAFRNNFQQEIAQPTFETFRNEVAPLLTESLSGFGTQRGNVLARASNQLQNDLLNKRFDAREAALNRSLGAIESGRQQSTLDVGLSAIPREIQQAGLDRAYQSFVQANEQYGQDINRALQFLGIQTQAFDQQPSTLEKLQALAKTAKGFVDIFRGGA